MTANVGYQSSAGLHETALNPACTKSSEPDYLYEKLSADLARDEKKISAAEGGGDDYYVNDDLHPGYEENTEVPEDAKLQSRSQNSVAKECKK